MDDLSLALFDVTLPANAPARLALPSDEEPDAWWRVGDATWLRALPLRSIQVQKPDEIRFTYARFKKDGSGLEVGENADWVRESDAVKGLAAELVEGLVRQLDASVPALPTRARPLPLSEPQLDWPATGTAPPEALRRRRLAGLTALGDYFDLVAPPVKEDSSAIEPNGKLPSGHMLRHLSAIPRPAEARVSLSKDGGDAHVLSWEQSGNPELLWGAAELSWDEKSRSLSVVRLPHEEAERKFRLGSWAHLLAMATAIEAATGGLNLPLRLRYRTGGGRPVTTTFTVAPGQWGFILAELVQGVSLGKVPEGLRFGTTV